MITKTTSLAILGAGPAGLSAAVEAAKLGVDTVVLDLHARAGGHYFNIPPKELQPAQPSSVLNEGYALIDQARMAGVEIWTGVEVWGIYPESPFRICLSGGEHEEIQAQTIIIATGAIERSWPFPGWTLPGVMTAGGALSLLKNQNIRPGRKVLVSGTGPLQLALASELVDRDVEVAAVLELKTWKHISNSWRAAVSTAATYPRLWEGLGYLRTLKKKKIPYRMGWSVIRALGDNEVTGAIIARVDAAGNPDLSTQQTVDVDCINLGYGLIPETQFTRLLECKHQLHPYLHVWTPVRDEWLQTSHPGVFAAGDAAGVFGKRAAVLEGKIAGFGAALQLKRLNEAMAAQLSRRARKQITSEYAFARLLHKTFSVPEDPCILASPDTLICRCECIQYAQILEAIRDGATSVQAVKYHSRAGMGLCRGIYCGPMISRLIALHGDIDLQQASRSDVRPPIFPVTLEEALHHEGLP